MDHWESICRQCGQCCFEKWIEADGSIITTRIACRYLDVVSRRCKVYPERLEVDEGCVYLTPELVAASDWLPDDCAYRVYLQQQR
jgi:uncharacterized cysteine cluster protein YcgN (CxxCxxCC family)